MATQAAPLSKAALRLQEDLPKLEYPTSLWHDFETGFLTVDDLRALLPDAWLYGEGREQVIGADKWVRLFRAAGFLAVPSSLRAPDGWARLFRGATEMRARGMAWYFHKENANNIRRRYQQFGPTQVYVTTAPRDAVLAIFQRPGDGPEVVVDPRRIGVPRALVTAPSS